MLLTKGLIRVGIGVPANAEFTLVSVANGVYCNPNNASELSMFRRPTPSNNTAGDLPLFTFRNTATGQVIQTTDPGRALISGRWADMARFKVPLLRALAARAPYFHNGSAMTLREVVEFYDNRFNIFGAGEGQTETDLINFLGSL